MKYEEYVEVVKGLNKMAELYAIGDENAVPDSVYDAEYRKLKEFEMLNPELILSNSPSQKVIDEANGFKKVEHTIPMISIQDSMGEEESQKWISKTVLKTKEDEFCIEYKIDGLGLDLKYQDGILIDAITRGNGKIGDSVLENAKAISSIPNKINQKGFFECRGEVVWEFDKFNKYNATLEIQLKNPRNGAAGALKKHDPEDVKKCDLTFIAYTIIEGSENKYQNEDLEQLKNLGFKVEPYKVVSSKTFHEFAEKMSLKRFDLDFPIDGIVIKVNTKELYDELGISGKCPNYYRAYKFPPEEATSKLIKIEQSIGSSGAITPVAIFEPINLAMTTVRRCSLHNWDLVEYLGLFIGCHVIIRKAGEIIPEIVECVETSKTKDEYKILKINHNFIPKYYLENNKYDYYVRPKVCPFCDHILIQNKNQLGEESVSLVCINEDCQAQMINKLSNFVGNNGMNIPGVGPAFIENLSDLGLVKTYSDIYKLTANDLIINGIMREKHAKEIIKKIEKSKDTYLANLINGFNIPSIGNKVSPLIANSIKSLIGDFSYNSLIKDGISDLIATKFITWVNNNKAECEFFANNNIAIKIKEIKIQANGPLSNEVCIMTGTFEKLPRKEFKDLVESLGGTVCGSISKKTTLILLGENAGPNKIEAIDNLKSSQNFKIFTNENIQEFFDLIKK